MLRAHNEIRRAHIRPEEGIKPLFHRVKPLVKIKPTDERLHRCERTDGSHV